MADRTKLDFNFISLVLQVSGRVRPVDLQNIAEPERVNALQAFYQAFSGTMPLHFDGDTLVKGAGGPGTSAPAPAPASAISPAQVPAVALPQAAAAPVSPEAAFVPPAPAPVSDYASVSGVASPGIPDSIPELAFAPVPQPVSGAIESDFFPPQADESAYDAPSDGDWAEFPGLQNNPQPVSFLWWLLPVFFTLIGGVAAFFLVRKRNAKRARALLITGIALTVLYAILAAAAVFGLGMLGLSAYKQAAEQVSVAATSTVPPVAADYPKWKIVEDRGIKTTANPASSDPAGKVRQDHAYLIEAPKGGVRILALYSRSAANMPSLRAKPWVNLDTGYRGSDGSAADAVALFSAFAKQHPGQLMLGAYKWTKQTAKPTFWVGWAEGGSKETSAAPTHGEYAYERVGASSWQPLKTAEKTTDAWATTGPVK